MAPRSPFAPTTTAVPNVSQNDSSQLVTIPLIPELYDPDFLTKIFPPPTPSTKKIELKDETPRSNPFMTALKDDFANRTLTENNSPAWRSTLSPTLDAFSTLGPDVSGASVHSILSKSWAADPEITLRLIWNLRSIHEGKAEKEVFYYAFGWLLRHHPRTAVKNLKWLVEPVIERKPRKKEKEEKEGKEDKSGEAGDDWTTVEAADMDVEGAAPAAVAQEPEVEITGLSHGYYKDLLTLLQLAALDQLCDPSPDSSFKALHTVRPEWTYPTASQSTRGRGIGGRGRGGSRRSTPRRRSLSSASTAVSAAPKGQSAEEQVAEAHKRLEKKLTTDLPFRALYVAVARIFAEKLAVDLSYLHEIVDAPGKNETLKWKISLASKWAPTLGGAHDRVTNIATAIASILHVSGHMSELTSVVPPTTEPLSASAALTVRSFYRRWIVTPLRRYNQIPELAMGANEWDRIQYSRVPSVCMKNNKSIFFAHDAERFTKYLLDVTQGKKKISGATLFPHELLAEAFQCENVHGSGTVEAEVQKKLAEANKTVIEEQWKTMVARLREAGTLDNCLAVADVSGSMGSLHYPPVQGKKRHYEPIWPCVALSMLLAQLARPPFQNTFITFSAMPELVTLDADAGLVENALNMGQANWTMNTDFQAVFVKLILPLAIKHKIKKEDMIKRLFVFSDMQFDNCRGRHGAWETDHEKITKAYAEAGYDVPEIVYWNLAGDRGPKPVTAEQKGVALVSGFSGNMLKVFMEGGEDEEEEALVPEEEDAAAHETKKAKKAEMDPVAVMLKALGKKSFAPLTVVD
ncbi:hypothetical protein BOTBODRAFT_39027 [Botryobasidium botryosum FD-172 SS1]|uniref:TROVE domain-containing protein n=1 Tax=Botryobasidium botryosum (strain FD-172 SS1) TaxID=930990 RepID=A0A067M6G9_BOTB1|nr:hypothetical protein BOTBODRAFT_39027 [Botryobasidium botryosum FD-172 SS1]